jgi:hypothetical protein
VHKVSKVNRVQLALEVNKVLPVRMGVRVKREMQARMELKVNKVKWVSRVSRVTLDCKAYRAHRV